MNNVRKFLAVLFVAAMASTVAGQDAFDISIPDMDVMPGESLCVPVFLDYTGTPVPDHLGTAIEVSLASMGPSMSLGSTNVSGTLYTGAVIPTNTATVKGVSTTTPTMALGEVFCIDQMIPNDASAGDMYTYTIDVNSVQTRVLDSTGMPSALEITDNTGKLTVIPEPTGCAMLLLGVGGLCWLRRRS